MFLFKDNSCLILNGKFTTTVVLFLPAQLVRVYWLQACAIGSSPVLNCNFYQCFLPYTEWVCSLILSIRAPYMTIPYGDRQQKENMPATFIENINTDIEQLLIGDIFCKCHCLLFTSYHIYCWWMPITSIRLKFSAKLKQIS